jgi:hypothetical protein
MVEWCWIKKRTRPAPLVVLFREEIDTGSVFAVTCKRNVYTILFSPFMASIMHGGVDNILMRQFLLVLILVSIQYTVNTGDSLQTIAERYCPGNDPRQVAEFREGIRELNYDVIGESNVWTGLVLEINRWE